MTSAPSPPSSQMSPSATLRKLLGAVAGMLLIVALTAFLVECMYRYYLSTIVADEVAKTFKPVERPSFGAYGIAPWIFDKEQGFVFDQRPWRTAVIKDGAFDNCAAGGQGNRFGNVGRAPDHYADADLRLLIVGSSYSMVGDEKGRFVDEVLMERLSKRLGRHVSVLNFSRDATGVLTYIDTARYEIDKLKPDAVIALINVTALIYQRHWRVVLPEEDGFRRMYFSLDPIPQPTDPARAVPQPIVINDNITEEWCRKMTEARSRGDEDAVHNDPLLKALITRHQKLQRDAVVPQILIDFWRRDVSFALNLLLTGDPFDGMTMFGDQPIYTPLTLDRYTDDSDFNAAVKHLKTSGVPFIPVHIPTLPQMRKYPDGGYEFAAHGVPPRRGASLVASLEQALGEPFVHLYRYYPSELKTDPLKLVNSAADSHPNQVGVDAMAEALEQLLLHHPRTANILKPAG
jgi:hypothetical protein